MFLCTSNKNFITKMRYHKYIVFKKTYLKPKYTMWNYKFNAYSENLSYV